VSVNDDIEQLRALEETLWRPETRQSPEWMDAVLAADFVEIGASGRVHDRAAVVAPTAGSLDVELPLPGFSARMLSADVALVTYESVQQTAEGERRARRVSVWVRSDGSWRLAFHQGTLVTDRA
jgi:ribonuclease HI